MPEINLFRHAKDQRTFAAGDVVCEDGDPAEEMYAVISGRLDILRGGEIVETVGPGDVFGEVALLAGEARAATARVAEDDTVVAVVGEAEFLRLVKMNPYFALEVMRFMADRLLRGG